MALPIGLHADVSELAYHRDPALTPSASAHLLKELFHRSPRHAWTAHPRLNPHWRAACHSEAQETGTILHSLILGTEHRFEVVRGFDHYKTKAARTARLEVQQDGKIPILERRFDELQHIAAEVSRVLADEQPHIAAALHDPDSRTEITAVYETHDVLCRSRFDLLPPPRYKFIADFKFTGLTAEPERWTRTLRENHLFQAALYPRAIEVLRGDTPEMRFVVCEVEEPFGVSVHALHDDLWSIANRRLDVALADWQACLDHDFWPRYARQVHYVTAPGWFLSADDDHAFIEQWRTAQIKAPAAPAVPTDD